MLRARHPIALGGMAVMIASCLDPVHSDAVNALGPEANGERPGPYHRPGQPCTVCHGSDGPAPEFSVAGTVFSQRGSDTPLAGATVQLTDRTGTSFSTYTNEAGNFYLSPREWQPTFPLQVELGYNGDAKAMITQIGRDGGCAVCHRNPGNASHMPGVYMYETPAP